MIVVVGGTGVLGRFLVPQLVGSGEQVRVLVRDGERARALFGDRVQVLAGDVRRGDDVNRAVVGASVVVSAAHGFFGGRGAGPPEVDHVGNVNIVDAAAANAARVVLVSALPASPDSKVDLFRAKAKAERYLRDSGVPWTIVQAGPFLQTWIAILTQTAGRSGRPLVLGKGEQPLAFVSASDVAAVVARAATDASLDGHALQVAGPRMTMNDLAQALQTSRGWQGAPRHVPRTALRVLAVVARAVDPAFARQFETALDMDTSPLPPGTPTLSPLHVPFGTLAHLLQEPTDRTPTP